MSFEFWKWKGVWILLQGKRGRKKSMSESGSAKKKYKKRGRKHSPEKKTKVGVQIKFLLKGVFLFILRQSWQIHNLWNCDIRIIFVFNSLSIDIWYLMVIIGLMSHIPCILFFYTMWVYSESQRKCLRIKEKEVRNRRSPAEWNRWAPAVFWTRMYRACPIEFQILFWWVWSQTSKKVQY